MPMLTDAGEISYNGFTFPLYRQSKLTGRSVYDTSRRATKYVEYTLEIDSTITAGPDSLDEVDNQLILLRKQLTTRGGRLEIRNTGFGPLIVNDPGGAGSRDVAYGPHPEIIHAMPQGSRAAWRVVWTCVFRIPECLEGTAVTQGRPLEFTYTWDVAIDEHGFSRRTIAGQLEIPATVLIGEHIPPDQADKYWNNVVASIPPIPSFKRQSQRTLSEDRRTLRFTITDQELSSDAFLPGITEWSGEQELSTNLQNGFTQWSNGLSATYKVARDQGKVVAFQHFMALVWSRTIGKVGNSRRKMIPVEFHCSDSLASQEVSFAFRWYFITEASLVTALQTCWMWTPLPNAGWAKWAASMARSALAARGDAQLFYSPISDTIIDLCATYQAWVPANGGGKPSPHGQLSGGGGGPGGGGANQPLQPTFPPPAESWLQMDTRIIWDSDEGMNVLRPLPSSPWKQPKKVSSDRVRQPDPQQKIEAKVGNLRGKNLANDVEGQGLLPIAAGGGSLGQNGGSLGQGSVSRGSGASAATPPNVIQRRSGRQAKVRLVGSALRFGYAIAAPQLVAAGGSPAVLMHTQYACGLVADVFGIPVFAASWDLEYVLVGEGDGDLPIPPNPAIGI